MLGKPVICASTGLASHLNVESALYLQSGSRPTNLADLQARLDSL
jgi:hypothetical protein